VRIAESNARLRRVLDFIGSGALARGDAGPVPADARRAPRRDEYLLLADYDSYVDCQHLVDAAFADDEAWTRKSILTVARMGRFSSDRAIREYAKTIWSAAPITKVGTGR
jgi:starch phosphorylase